MEDQFNLKTHLDQMETMVGTEIQDGLPVRRTKPQGFHYYSMFGFVSAHGHWGIPQALPAEFEEMEKQQCFKNSFELGLQHIDELFYVEGYGVSGATRIPLPIHHAWLEDRNGNVVDPTWSHASTSEYYGVRFDWDFLIAAVTEKGSYGVIDNYENGFPLLRHCPEPEYFLLDMSRET